MARSQPLVERSTCYSLASNRCSKEISFLYVLSPNVTSVEVLALKGPGQATSFGSYDFTWALERKGIKIGSYAWLSLLSCKSNKYIQQIATTLRAWQFLLSSHLLFLTLLDKQFHWRIICEFDSLVSLNACVDRCDHGTSVLSLPSQTRYWVVRDLMRGEGRSLPIRV